VRLQDVERNAEKGEDKGQRTKEAGEEDFLYIIPVPGICFSTFQFGFTFARKCHFGLTSAGNMSLWLHFGKPPATLLNNANDNVRSLSSNASTTTLKIGGQNSIDCIRYVAVDTENTKTPSIVTAILPHFRFSHPPPPLIH
jgi:hypothetical protein